MIVKEYCLEITVNMAPWVVSVGVQGGRGGGGCFSCGMRPCLRCLSTGHRVRRSTPVHWFWDFERGAPSRRPDPRNLKFLNWLSGHNCPESNRIAEVGLVRAHAELAIDVGALAFSWEGWGLVSPGLTLLILPSDQRPGRVG